jgi:hypothetical protein
MELPRCREQHRIEKLLVDLQRASQLLFYERRDDSGHQKFRQRSLAAARVAILELPNQIGAAQAERLAAVEDKSSDGVSIFAKSSLHDRRHQESSIRGGPGRISRTVDLTNEKPDPAL